MGRMINQEMECKGQTDQLWEEEKSEFGFGYAELHILLIFEHREIKLRKELGAKVRDLDINKSYMLKPSGG